MEKPLNEKCGSLSQEHLHLSKELKITATFYINLLEKKDTV